MHAPHVEGNAYADSEEDLSNITDNTNFSSVLLSKSPILYHDGMDSGFIDDNSLPELERLEEFIKYLEKDLLLYDDEIKTIQDLRKDVCVPSSSSRPFLLPLRETDVSLDETDHEENYNDQEDVFDLIDELREDEHRLRYYQQCLQSPTVIEATYCSATKAPYQTPSMVNISRNDEQEILDTPSRVDEMLAAIYDKGYTNRGSASIATIDDYDFIQLPHNEEKPSFVKKVIRPSSFFESALDDDVECENDNNPEQGGSGFKTSSSLWDTTNDSIFSGLDFTPSMSMSQHNSSIKVIREDFTIDSLKRNWEMEDENSDEDDDGFVLPDRSSPVVNVFPSINNFVPQIEDQENRFVNGLSSPIISTVGTGDELKTNLPPISVAEKAAAIASFHIPTSDTQDLRLNGDFSVWSNGKMLNPIHLHRDYVGLTPSAVSHVVSGGKLVPIIAALHDLNSGNNLLHLQNNGKPSMSNYENVTPVLPTGEIRTANNSGSSGFYMLHTVECVIRPDIELKSVMAIVVKLAKHLKCKCILQKRSHAILSQRMMASNPGAIESGGKEWEQLDVQICVNRELRQRVVLMQFMRNCGIFGSSGLAILANQLVGPLENVPLSKCPSTKRLVSIFKKEMITQELTLSCLYTIPMDKVCALPKGLDRHFLAQLHSLCRESMLQKLTVDYKGMEEHLKEQAIETKMFVETLEPILRQYNIHQPQPWSKKRVGAKALEDQVKQERSIVESMSSEAIINSLQDFDRQFLTSPERKKSKYQIAYFSSDDAPSTPERTSGYVIDSPLTAISAVSTSSSCGDKPTVDVSFQTVSLHSPTSSPMLRKYRSEIESVVDENMDGMTLCLMLLDKFYQNLQHSCDSEYEQRVQQRNSSTILLIEDMLAYRKEILLSIINFPEIFNTSTMKAFQQTFQGVRVMKESSILAEKKKDMELTAQNQAQAEINNKVSSWFSGIGAKLGIGTISMDSNDRSKNSSPSSGSDIGVGKNNYSPKKKEVPFRLSSAIVLYYCTGLIGNVPGTVYITQRHICLTSSVLGFNAKREIFALDHLTDVSLISSEGIGNVDTNSSSGIFASNTLRLAFYFGLREITITPMVIDCLRVKSIIELIQQQFSE